jgi:hypothetical protein
MNNNKNSSIRKESSSYVPPIPVLTLDRSDKTAKSGDKKSKMSASSFNYKKSQLNSGNQSAIDENDFHTARAESLSKRYRRNSDYQNEDTYPFDDESKSDFYSGKRDNKTTNIFDMSTKDQIYKKKMDKSDLSSQFIDDSFKPKKKKKNSIEDGSGSDDEHKRE